MKYRKIKFNGTEVHIERMVKSASAHDERTDTLKSFDAPRPEFNDAMQAFAPSVRRLLELPGDYDLRVTGLSISYQAESERRGLVITCQKKLADANAPLVFNTPHLPEKDIDDPNPSWPQEWYDLLDDLCEQATAYVDGKREQQDLFGDEANPVAWVADRILSRT